MKLKLAALSRACTIIKVGDGKNTNFWDDRWLQGLILKEVAHTLHRLVWRKNFTVAEGMDAGKWMRGLHQISTQEETNQFIHLWQMLRQVQLTNQADSITWQFTTDGNYSTTSAYTIQFVGLFANYEWVGMWKVKVEHKCRLFYWLILQNKIWTADRIIKTGDQPNVVCQLCHTQPESVLHMFTQRAYSKLVWSRPSTWIGINLHPSPSSNYGRFKTW
jgi:hypothetical protein